MAKASTTSKAAQSTSSSRTKACSSKMEAGRERGSKSSSRGCCGRGSRTSKTSK